MFTVTRTQEEIVARFEAADYRPGWIREVLIDHLDYEYAAPFLVGGITAGEFDRTCCDDLDSEIRRELIFAVGKIKDERGVGAEWSTIRLAELAWLAGRDDVVAAMGAAEYAPYGEPKVREFAAGMGLDWPE
jgi:hypothetical protein